MGLTSQTAALSLSVLAVVDLPYTYDLARATTKNWQGLDEWLVRLLTARPAARRRQPQIVRVDHLWDMRNNRCTRTS